MAVVVAAGVGGLDFGDWVVYTRPFWFCRGVLKTG